MIYKESEISENNEIHHRINKHESKLVKIETILERVATNQDKMANSIETISNSISKQELILEKLANLEENTKGSINRLHLRVDEVNNVIETRRKKVDENFRVLEPITLFAKYPKLFVFTLVGFYVFSIKDFRDAIFGGP